MKPSVLIVTSRFPFGPKEAFVREEVAELERSCDVYVVPSLPSNEPLAVPALAARTTRFRLLSPTVIRLAFGELIARPVRVASAFIEVLRGPRSFAAKLKNAAVFPTALAISAYARDRRVSHVHGYWLSTPATVAFVVSRLNGITWSATGHRYDLVDFNIRTLGGFHGGLLDRASFVRVISDDGASRVRRALAKPERVHTGYLGVRIPERLVDPPVREMFELVCVANLVRVKGHPVLFHAIAKARETGISLRCTLIGDGPDRADLLLLARQLRIDDAVRFLGVVAHEEVLRRLHSGEFDVGILTSIDDGPTDCEGVPTSLMEAMAARLPVIATRSGAVGELVGPESGILCEPHDVDAIAAAIVRLARAPHERRALGAAGYGVVQRRFNIEHNTKLIAERFAMHEIGV